MLFQRSEHIFISYSPKDQKPVSSVVDALQRDGYPTWCERDAADYADRISSFAENIAGCGLFIAFISKNYIVSASCMKDLDFALLRKKPVLFIFMEDISLPFSLLARMKRPSIIRTFCCSCFEEFYLQLTSHPLVLPFKTEAPLPQDYIFISYAHRDRAAVYPLLEKLAREGFSFWVDQRLEPAEEFFDEIAEKLDGCGLVIPFISEAYLESKNCRNELNYAGLLLQKDILPVYLEKVHLPPGMRMNFSMIQSILGWELENREEIFRRLVGAEKMQGFRG